MEWCLLKHIDNFTSTFEGLLPCSLEPSTESYPKPVKYSSHPRTLFL